MAPATAQTVDVDVRDTPTEIAARVDIVVETLTDDIVCSAEGTAAELERRLAGNFSSLRDIDAALKRISAGSEYCVEVRAAAARQARITSRAVLSETEFVEENAEAGERAGTLSFRSGPPPLNLVHAPSGGS